METPAQNTDANANSALIESFCEITASSKQEALFFLESHNFDLDAAVSTFLENNTDVVINDNNVPNPVLPSHSSPSPPESHSPDLSPSQSPSRSRSRSPSPTPSRAPYELRSGRNRGKKPSGSRTGGIRTLADLKRPRDGSDSDSDSDEPQGYYTGGEKRCQILVFGVS